MSAAASATEGPDRLPKYLKGDSTMYADYSYEQAMAAIDWADESDTEDWPDDLWDD